MKIKVKKMNYEAVMDLPGQKHQNPVKQRKFFRWLLKTASEPALKAVNFEWENKGMDRLEGGQSALYLMNHSCFLDLNIASKLLSDHQYHIICTNDGFVGKNTLMRYIGCIPTKKFITDVTLVKDMVYAVKKLDSSILLYPEASYSFDGTATPLPDTIGKLVKMLGIPVVMIRTYGAFQRDPLYNGLRLRKVKVNAIREYLLSPEDIKELSAGEISEKIRSRFDFDHFRWQNEHQVIVNEDFRATGLERVLYKCPECGKEGTLKGQGTRIRCCSCGNTHELTEYGRLKKISGPKDQQGYDTLSFNYVTDWYAWQRDCVKKEIDENTYLLDVPVRIMILKDTKAVYDVGKGRLVHDRIGFRLDGCDGKLHYTQRSESSYSLYADYFWYEIGDVICIGDSQTQYYCFPLDYDISVAKARIAAEEMYMLTENTIRNTTR